MPLTKKAKTGIAATALAPFLITWGMTLNDVKLSDGQNFDNHAKYIEYRDPRLSKIDSLDEYLELGTIWYYESQKAGGFLKTVDDLNAMQADPLGFYAGKIKAANP